ncbi:MAG: DUF3492 domain-containing protein, partial [Eubacteriales bacterium]|nr:DUF3492 domain-containing protein [Eubacteriales bacterium]
MRICVICEGSYPFVMGGVSSWLQGLMTGMPQHTFTIWAIGAQKKQRGHLAYKLPENVESVREVFLDEILEGPAIRNQRAFRLSGAQRDALKRLISCEDPD